MSDICIGPLENLVLKHGHHNAESGEYCVIEAAVCRFTKGKIHSDKAQDCNASPRLVNLMIKLNDRWSETRRQQLKQFVDRIPNTRGTDEQELQRGYMVADWAIRELLPIICDYIGAPVHAEELRSLAAIVDEATAAEGYSWAQCLRSDAYAYADAAYVVVAGTVAADVAYVAYAAAYADVAYDAAYVAYVADSAVASAIDATIAYAGSEIPAGIDASLINLIDRLIKVTSA